MGAVIDLDTGAGNNSLQVTGRVGGLLLNVNGQGGSLTVDESQTQNTPTQSHDVVVTTTGQTVAYSDQVSTHSSGPQQLRFRITVGWTMAYSDLPSLALYGGAVMTAFNVQSTASATPVNLVAGAAGNTFQLGSGGSVKNIQSLVTVVGQGASGTAIVDDSSATAQDQVTVANGAFGDVQVGMAAPLGQFFGTGGGLDADDMTALTLDLSAAAGDVVQLAPSVGTALTVNGNAAEYKAGHGGVLTMNLIGVSNPILTPGGPGAGKWTFGNVQPVTYTNMANSQVSQNTPTVQVSDASGNYDGQPFTATATVAGTDGTPESSLEGVSPTLSYVQLFANGTQTPLSSAPTMAGNYEVDANFAGSADYTSASAQTTFTIGQATPVLQVSATSGTYNGQPVAVTATVAGVVAGVDNTPGATLEGVGVTLTYYQLFANGAVDQLVSPPTSAGAGGNYEVVASFAGSTDYAAFQQSASFTIGQAAPTVQVSDFGGVAIGLPYPATATVAGVVAGVDNTPGPTLEGVGLSLDYQLLDANGNVLTDLGSSAPSQIGSYQVIASFAGSTDYTSGSAVTSFFIFTNDT